MLSNGVSYIREGILELMNMEIHADLLSLMLDHSKSSIAINNNAFVMISVVEHKYQDGFRCDFTIAFHV